MCPKQINDDEDKTKSQFAALVVPDTSKQGPIASTVDDIDDPIPLFAPAPSDDNISLSSGSEIETETEEP